MYEIEENRKMDKASWFLPLLRCVARLIDLNVFGLLIVNFLYYTLPNIYQRFDKAFGFYILFLWVFIEAIFLSTWGTTLGKWLLRITISREDKSRISYLQALKRSFQVYVKVCGFGFPIIWLIAPIISYVILVRNKKASWDKNGEFNITYEKISFIRGVVITILVLFLIFLFFVNNHNTQMIEQAGNLKSLMSNYN